MLIRNFLNAKMEKTPIHGGEGVCENTMLFAPEDFEAPLRFLNYTTVPPKASFGQHQHGDDNEVYVVLEGSGEYTENGVTQQVSAGDILVNARFACHSIVNTGDQEMRLIVFEAFNENILEERRSCRKYQDKPVPEEVIAKILRAGTYAATGMGRQSPVILAVTNREMRDRLSKMNAAVMGTDADPFYGAPAVLVVLADKNIRTCVYDGSLVMGNMMNAAEKYGVASCWIHRAKEMFETEEGKQILHQAGISGDYEGIGNLVIGYADGEKNAPAPRKEDYIHWIR